LRIVFHASNAAPFRDGFETFLDVEAEVLSLPAELPGNDAALYAAADVIIGTRFDGALPMPANLRLFHVPGAGYEGVQLDLLPPGATACNSFGHEGPIVEYVMAALLADAIPFDDADARLRRGEWAYNSGSRETTHGEIAGRTLGILGFGHIGRFVAERAKQFGMTVHVANRSPVPVGPTVDRSFALDRLGEFWRSADAFVIAVPLTTETTGIVSGDAFAAIDRGSLLINVARGPVVDAQALYDALKGGRLRKAVIDTWYDYPTVDQSFRQPSELPFHELSNVVMTPHMSGWTMGTVRRRQELMARNIGHIVRGEPCENVIRPVQGHAL
jgi:phosphoglycerate dehydrogenase-like enzyme